MAINKNHEFEELGGVKCGIVERNVTPARLQFLKSILEFNQYTVIAVPVVPKTPAAVKTEGEDAPVVPTEPIAEAETLYTVGVTDYTFNPINAIFGRLLKAPDGSIITLAYWQQKADLNDDEVPYFKGG